MGVRVATTLGNCFHWSHRPLLPPRCSSPQTSLASTSTVLSSISLWKIAVHGCEYPSLACQISDRGSLFLGTTSKKLLRWRLAAEYLNASAGRKSKKDHSMQRAPRASLDQLQDGNNDNEESLRHVRELALELQDSSNVAQPGYSRIQEAEITSLSPLSSTGSVISSSDKRSAWSSIIPRPPKWLNGDGSAQVSVEMVANSVDLPLSLCIIKRKKRWEERAFKEASESDCCSIKKAFASMVFIVQELQSYILQMREIPFYENLQVILGRVQGEMNASFVWLFQQIFSHTPTLMLYVMLLLANFTVYSISHNSVMAAVSSTPPTASVEQTYQRTENQQQNWRFDLLSVNSFSVGRTASVGGGGDGGGGMGEPVAGANDDGRSDGSCSSYSTTHQEETSIWNMIVEEAHGMQASSTDEALMDSNTLQLLVSPVTVELEPDNYAEYSETEIMYHRALSQDPDNVLLISNFAQFLYLVLHENDRAEYYFKRAVGIKPTDAEALHRYANFLWIAKKDLGAAEEAYLEAIGADPSNTCYAANYAHFLWNTGGEDTCYPLDGNDAY